MREQGYDARVIVGGVRAWERSGYQVETVPQQTPPTFFLRGLVTQPRIVTLTTDFGLHDHYVGAMKGVILNVNPEVRLVDICHSVQPFDVLDGALTIAQTYRYFPSDSIHVVVVDPGVGSE